MEESNTQFAFGFTTLGVEKLFDWKFMNCLEYPTFKRYFKRRSVSTDVELKVLGWFTADKDFLKLFKQADIIVCTEGYENLAQYFAGLYVKLFNKEIIYKELLGKSIIVHKGTSLEYTQKGFYGEPYGDPFIDTLAKRAFKRVQSL